MACVRQLVRGAVYLIASCAIHFGNTSAQEILQSALGSAKNDQFGTAVAIGPDLDGDGFREVAVGAPTVNATVTNGGAAYVLSGRDFSRMQTIQGAIANGDFGKSVCWCGDVDGDGLPDLAIGAPGEAARSIGSVSIYSSSTWTLLRTLQGSTTVADRFGMALADAGDLNGDGIDDLLVGAPKAAANGADSGAMLVCSGSDGSLLWSIDGVARSGLGASLAAVGDLNGDGYVDVAVGEPAHDGTYLDDNAGVVEVYSGKDQSVLQKWTGATYFVHYTGLSYPYGDQLGIAVGPAGDFDGDGVPDVWAASGRGVSSRGFSYVNVYSGASGATLRTMKCMGILQSAAATIGDVDGDGLPEFASVGRLFESVAYVFSSVDGKVLWQFDRLNGYDEFASVAGDPASSSDFLFGMGRNNDVAFHAGRVELRATNDLWLDVAPTHFPFKGETLSLAAAEGPAGNSAMLALTGLNGTPMFVLLSLASFDATGTAALLTAAVPPGLSGTTLTVRAFAIGASGKLVDSIDETITPQ
jgi:FG-GAP repeat protein